jgi:transcriptional regulator with XRE-family HTH domain
MRHRAVKRKVVRKAAVKKPILVQLGRGIVALRSRHGLSRQELATRLEVTYAQLGFWERGTCGPSCPKLIAITEILEASVPDLIAAGEPQP